MKTRTLIALAAVILVACGTAALIYRGFDYSGRTRRVELGPVELAVKKQERVEIPVWVGAGAIGVGVVLLLLRRK
jgi:hypothetical protein